MKRLTWIFGVILPLLVISACANKDAAPANAPRATVFLRDGGKYTGTVKSSSPTAITVAGDNNSTRTFDMRDVKSIDYNDAAPSQLEPHRTSSGGSAPVAREHPTQAHIRSKTLLLPAGTEVSVRTDETIDSSKAVQGQTFAAEVAKDVHDSAGDVVIPRGSNAIIIIRSASKGGNFRGAADLALDLQSVAVDGRQYRLDTTDLEERGRQGLGKNKRTGEFVGGGAAIGAIIGAIAGGGKGAAIGAGSGAAAGVATDLLTRGKAVRVPAETVLTFKLDKPLRVYPAR